jgi:hypothetical protein
MQEIWKDIEDYEGLYQVSNFGRIKSLDKIVKGRNNYHLRKGKILIGRKDGGGYLMVALYKNRKRKDIKIHKLVAKCFIPNILKKPEINHIDRNKNNNSDSNLEWVTSKENSIHFIETGATLNFYNNAKKQGLKYGGNKKAMDILKNKLSKKVKQINSDTGKVIKIWDSSMEIQRKLGIPNQAISRSIKRKIKAGGFLWEH